MMKNIILLSLLLTLLTSCATLKPTVPETPKTPEIPIEQMSTYDLQNEYLEVEHKINELEKKLNDRKSSQVGISSSDFTGNSAILLIIALNSLNAYNMNNMVTKLEKYSLRLSDITDELTKRGMYGP